MMMMMMMMIDDGDDGVCDNQVHLYVSCHIISIYCLFFHIISYKYFPYNLIINIIIINSIQNMISSH